MSDQTEPKYLGDAVYAEFDGYSVTLIANRGGGPAEKRVYLEPGVWAALVRYGVRQGFEIPEDVR